MELTELFYPEIRVSVGSYCFTQGIAIEAHSSAKPYFDWAKIRFTGAYQPEVSIARRDLAQIDLGYSGTLQTVFRGSVTRPYNSGSGADEITCKDDMLLLEQTKISNTFLNVTPQEVISYGLKQAGIKKAVLSPQTYPERRRVSIREMSVLKLLSEVHAAWGIQHPFFFSDGVFYWGTRPEQQQVYRFEYGVNILNLARIGGAWELETVSAPFVRHSHKIEVLHPQVQGVFTVSDVDFHTNDGGFIRTTIHF